MRSARVRSLLGITTDDLPNENENANVTRENRLKKAEARHAAVAENEDETDASRVPQKLVHLLI